MSSSVLLVNKAAERNKLVILPILQRLWSESKSTLRVLEVAAGTLTHCEYFVEKAENVIWQPTEYDYDGHLANAEFRRKRLNSERLLPLKPLDCMKAPSTYLDDNKDSGLTANGFDFVYCCNMVHISPWACTAGLFAHSAAMLDDSKTTRVVLYGPYIEDDVETAESNIAFDLNFLKARNPEWGLRNLKDVVKVAEKAGFELEERLTMPANNLTVIFRRDPKQ